MPTEQWTDEELVTSLKAEEEALIREITNGWTEEEMAAFDQAMRQGKYLTGLDISLKAQARIEGRPTDDDSVYAPIMDSIFGPRQPNPEGGS